MLTIYIKKKIFYIYKVNENSWIHEINSQIFIVLSFLDMISIKNFFLNNIF